MKRKLNTSMLMSVLLIGSLNSFSQLERGNLFIGADVADFDLDLGSGQNFAFDISPKLAWFVKDNLAVGGYLRISLSTAKNAGTSVLYGIGGLGRYYLGGTAQSPVHHGRIFVEANVGAEGFNPATGDNTNGLGLGAGPGWAFFVTENVGLEALVKYNSIIGFGSAASSNRIHLGVGFQIYLPSAKARALKKPRAEQ
jgi:hypothetical protein